MGTGPKSTRTVHLGHAFLFPQKAQTSHPDAYDAALFDWLLIGIFAGFRKIQY